MGTLNVNTTDNQINITPTDTQIRIFSGGYAQPGGANTEVQYNNGGVLAGAANITYTNGNMVISNNNFKITGGDNGYFLQTDGQGNLTWYPGTAFPTGNGQVGGANTQIQFNNSGNFGGIAGLTVNVTNNNVAMPNNLSVVGNVSANYFIGNGALLTGISVDSTQIVNGNSNVKVTANGNVTVSVAGNANVLTVTGTDVSATGNVSASYFIGNGAILTGLNASNLSSGTVLSGRISGNYTGIIGTGALGTGSITNTFGNINIGSNIFTGNGSGLTSLTGANVTGTVANATNAVSATTAGTVTSNAQPNITSLGTLTSLSVTGNANVGNLRSAGILSAVGNANVGNIGATNGIFTSMSGNGVSITGLNASNLASGTVPSARVTGNYTGITGIGTLTDLSVSGNATIGNNANIGGQIFGSGNINCPNLYVINTLVVANGTGGDITGANAIYSNAIQANTWLRTAVYADTAARDAAIPSPVAGIIVLVSDVGGSPKFQGFDGIVWANLS